MGTVSGTLWYVNWQDMTSIRLVGGHPDKINDIAVGQGDLVSLAVEDGSLRVWNRGKNVLPVMYNIKCVDLI